jgi:LPS export ABC transporter protein LptC
MRFFFLLSIVLYSCSNDPQAVKEFILSENLPIERIEEAEIFQTENGSLKLKIVAGTIKRLKEIQPELVFSNGIEIVFYNDSGSIKSTLTATNAEVNKINNIMTASESVVLSSEEKRLETEELIWDEKRNKIYTDKKVIIITSKEVIEGKGFESNPDFSKYSISKIQGTFNFKTSAD